MADTPSTVEQATLAIDQETENIIRFVEYFDKMDASSPMMRFIIAGAVVGASLLCMLIARLIVRSRTKRLENLPSERFKPLRIQRQDLLSPEDMKAIRISIWMWVGRVITVVLLLTAAIGALLTSRWTLEWAARLIAMLVAPLKFSWFAIVDYIPNLLTIVIIVALARFLIHLIGMVFQGVKTKRIRIPNFYPEFADPSFILVKLMIWVLPRLLSFPTFRGPVPLHFKGYRFS